jgi:hypothetical protein
MSDYEDGGQQFIDKQNEQSASEKVHDLKAEMELLERKIQNRIDEGKYHAGN